MGATGMAQWRFFECGFYIFGQGGACALVHQHGFSCDALRIDDLVAIKQKLEVIDKTTLHHADAVLVDKMSGLNQ